MAFCKNFGKKGNLSSKVHNNEIQQYTLIHMMQDLAGNGNILTCTIYIVSVRGGVDKSERGHERVLICC